MYVCGDKLQGWVKIFIYNICIISRIVGNISNVVKIEMNTRIFIFLDFYRRNKYRIIYLMILIK